MPQIGRFNGILIEMYFQDHVPPHFHAKYSQHRLLVAFDHTVRVHQGSLPRPQEQAVLAWARNHQQELRDNWNLAQIPTTLNWIAYP